MADIKNPRLLKYAGAKPEKTEASSATSNPRLLKFAKQDASASAAAPLRSSADVQTDLTALDSRIKALEDEQKALNRNRLSLEANLAQGSIGGNMAQDEAVLAVNAARQRTVDKELQQLATKRYSLSDELKESRYSEYSALASKDDYAAKSAVATAQNSLYDPNLWRTDRKAANAALNNVEDENRDLNYGLYQHMTDEELGIYNYLRNTNGDEAAKQYLDFIVDYNEGEGGSLKYREGKARANVAQGAAGTLGLAAISGVDRFAVGLGQLGKKDAADKSITQYAAEITRERLGNGLGVAFDVTQAVGNMAPSVLLSYVAPTLGLASFGASAGGNAYAEKVREGYAPDNARTYAALVGLSEVALQHALGGIAKLGGAFNTKVAQKIANIDNAIGRVAAKVGYSSLAEGFEEGLQETLEPVFATVALDDKFTAPEAGEVAYAFLLGALTGGLFEGVNIATAEPALKKAGKEVRKGGKDAIQAVIDKGMEADEGSPNRKLAEVLQTRIDKGGRIGNYQLGRLQKENEREAARGFAEYLVKPEEEEYGREISLDESSKRYDGASAGEQTGGLEQGAKSAAREPGRSKQQQAAVDRRAKSETYELRASRAIIGNNLGADNASVRVVPDADYDAELQEVASRTFAETGKRVTFFVGEIETSSGERAEGAITDDGIYVRVDSNDFTATQLAAHEEMHARLGGNKELFDSLAEKVKKKFEGKIDQMLERYADTYGGFTEDDVDYLLEEIICDAYAGMNRRGTTASEAQETVRSEVEARKPQKDTSTDAGRAPPKKKTAKEELADLKQRYADGEIGEAEYDAAEEAIMSRPEMANADNVDEVKFSIAYTTDNRPVAIIDSDIFDGRFAEMTENERLRMVKSAIKGFRPGIPVSGRLVGVSRKTADHFMRSNDTDRVRNHEPQVYEDKLRVARNIDDVVYASTNYVNEDKKHERWDNIDDFARGVVLLDIGGNKYQASVVVGYTDMQNMLLYDVQDLKPTSFEYKKKKAQPKLAGNESDTRRTVAPSSKESVAQATPEVKRFSFAEYTDAEKQAHNEAVLDYFGKTYSWAETGYILLDGSRPDFSGRHEGARGGYRTVDHREIAEALGDDYGDGSYSGALTQFMYEGNIRISPESNGINLVMPPTKAQRAALASFISRMRGEVILDIDDENGNTVVSVEYPHGTHANKVLNDIDNWFENGEEPYVSSLAQFRFSVADNASREQTDKDYLDAVSRGDMGAAQRMVDEAAKDAGYTVETYHGTDKDFTVFETLFRNEYGYHVGTKAAAESRNEYKLNAKVLRLYTKLGRRIQTTDVFGYFAGMHDYIFYVRGEMDKIDDQDFIKQLGRKKKLGNNFPDNEYLKQMHAAYVDFHTNGYRASDAKRVVELTQKYLKSIGVDSIAYKNAYEAAGSTSYLLLYPNQVKSADPVVYDDDGNVIPLSERFKQDNPDIRFSVADRQPAPTFYSKLEREVDGMKQTKIGASSVISYLKGRGVKDEEIKWSGIEAFLSGKKSVSKDELLEFVRGNQLEIEEKTLGSVVEYSEEQRAQLDELDAGDERALEEISDLWLELFDDDLPLEFVESDRKREWMWDELYGTTIMDEPEGNILFRLAGAMDENDQWREQIRKEAEGGDARWKAYTLDGGDHYRELLFKMPGATYTNTAMSGHWGESGVLAHARVQDMESGGDPVLFVEEIQSDWHNEGSKRGYGDFDFAALNRKLEGLYDERKVRGGDNRLDAEIAQLENTLYPARTAARNAIDAHIRKIYKDEVLRKVHADLVEYVIAENTRIGYPPTQQQAEQYAENMLLSARDSNEIVVRRGLQLAESERDVVDNFISEYNELYEVYRGADEKDAGLRGRTPDAPFRTTYHEFVLKRLLREAAENGYSYLAWTPGWMQEERWSSEFAEGYRIEYDQDIPKFLNKYGKQWGARVEDIPLDGQANVTVHALPITDAMRESVMYEGQPRFSFGEQNGYTRDTIPKKAQTVLKSEERILVDDLAEKLSVPKTAQRDFIKPIVAEITDEYLASGDVSQKTLDELFETAYKEGRIIDDSYQRDNDHIRKYLRDVGVAISRDDASNIADWNAFRAKLRGIVKLDKKGIAVSKAYQELHDMNPGLFPEDIIHPADQLQRMYEVGKDLRDPDKYTLEEAYAGEAEEFKKWAKNDFIARVQKFLASLKNTRMWLDERAAEKAGAYDMQLTTEQAMAKFDEMRKARRAVDKVMNRTLLTKNDEELVNRMLRDGLSMDAAMAAADTPANVSRVYNAKWQYEMLVKELKAYKATIRRRYREAAEVALENSGSWQNKSMFALNRETPERVFEMVMGEDAPALIKEYLWPIAKAEANKRRMIERYRDRVRRLDLSRELAEGNVVTESHMVQLLGEAQHNIRYLEEVPSAEMRDGKTLEEWRTVVSKLWAENPHMDEAKIKKAIYEFQHIYDKLYQHMNAVRVKNGYEPIAYRQGYFPHFQPNANDGILDAFGKVLGVNTDVASLPTAINGLTHSFRPGITYFNHAQQRIGFNTVYDAVEGFEKYIHGAADMIYQTANIQKLRALENEIRYRTTTDGVRDRVDAIMEREDKTSEEKSTLIEEEYQNAHFEMNNFVVWLREYTDALANKKSGLDRATENLLGRGFYEGMTTIMRRVAGNMVAINPGSWLTNLIPLTQASAVIDSNYLLNAMHDAAARRGGRGVPDGYMDMLGDSVFLTNRKHYDPLVSVWEQSRDESATMTKVRRTAGKWEETLSKPMEIIDYGVAEVIVRARYMQNLERGLSEVAALEEADQMAARIMAGRSKGAMPNIFNGRNPLLRLFTQFQLEVNNQLSFMFKDVPDEYKDRSKAALAMALMSLFLQGWLFNQFYELLTGRRTAFDPIELVNEFVGDATGYEIPSISEATVDMFKGENPFETERQGIGEAMAGLGKGAAEELPFVGGLLGGGRLPISSALPKWSDVGQAIAPWSDWSAEKRAYELGTELAKPLAYIAMPFGGGQLKKTLQGLNAVRRGGSYSVNAAGEEILQYPVFTDNALETGVNIAKAAAFGKSSLPTAVDWVDSNFDSMSTKETALYQALVDVGEKQHLAYDFVRGLSAAENAAAKRDYIVKADLSGDARAAAYYTVATDKEKVALENLADNSNMQIIVPTMAKVRNESKQLDKFKVLSDAEMDDREYMELMQTFMSEDSFEVIRKATEYGLSVEAYVKVRGTLDAYDANNNGSYSQAEITNAIDALGGGALGLSALPGYGVKTMYLTEAERAILWQVLTGSKNANSNPYSTSVAQRYLNSIK